MQPSEFWALSPEEFWLEFDAKVRQRKRIEAEAAAPAKKASVFTEEEWAAARRKFTESENGRTQ